MPKHKQSLYKAPRVDTGEWITGYIAYQVPKTEDASCLRKTGKYFMHRHEKGAEPKVKLYNIEVDGNKAEPVY
jgi:hypothetical protein